MMNIQWMKHFFIWILMFGKYFQMSLLLYMLNTDI